MDRGGAVAPGLAATWAMTEPATLDGLLEASAREYGEHLALTLGGRDLTYRDLAAAVDRLATRLAPDVPPGHRVAIVAPNVPALVIGLFATWRLGGVAVPLSARYREYELRQILGAAAPTAVISLETVAGYSFAALFRTLLPQLPTLRRCLFVDSWAAPTSEIARAGPAVAAMAAPVDPEFAAILYTSGTTGEPKGVLVSHRRELDTAAALNGVLSAGPADRCVFIIPLSHAFGLSCFIATVAGGSQALLVESSFSLAPMLRAIEERQATILHGSPALFASLLKAGTDRTRTLRTGFVAGALCPPSLLSALAPDLPLLNLYGATEVGAATCCRLDDPPERRFTTVGRPLPGYEIRTVAGEVQVRGRSVSPDYYRQPDQADVAFENGWFRTGDLGLVDECGYLSITGRTKEMVQVAGHTVSPAEVEGLLLTHPDVEQAVVVGVPHEVMGEVLRAFVVARPGSSPMPSALLQFTRARIAGYKVPSAISLVSEIPTLASGKPDRRAVLRAIQEADDGG